MTVFRKAAVTPHITIASDGLPEYILSDATPDRYGDVVEAAGIGLTNFKRNPIALFNHNPDRVIGVWKSPRVINGQLRAHLQLAPKGTSADIDEIHALVDADILNAVSIGFLPKKHTPIGKGSGNRYTESELVEASLVSIPANPNALAIAKRLHISDAGMKMLFDNGGKTLAERQRDARQILARASRIMGRDITAPKSRTQPRSRTYIPETKLLSYADEVREAYEHMTADEIVACELALQKQADRAAKLLDDLKHARIARQDAIHERQVDAANPSGFSNVGDNSGRPLPPGTTVKWGK